MLTIAPLPEIFDIAFVVFYNMTVQIGVTRRESGVDDVDVLSESQSAVRLESPLLHLVSYVYAQVGSLAMNCDFVFESDVELIVDRVALETTQERRPGFKIRF